MRSHSIYSVVICSFFVYWRKVGVGQPVRTPYSLDDECDLVKVVFSLILSGCLLLILLQKEYVVRTSFSLMPNQFYKYERGSVILCARKSNKRN